ncbi:hypothetical protein OSB04_028732 [Centaurea solstitialis]|uniref:SWIM-type domain-containing protein n=1 Tax=Centaurea solstitialis TaxID=347529 RepID=A0AA38WBH1_9ASTR|nr:hypothetical protein OSB04_028732 [Centaurea solstitialis]
MTTWTIRSRFEDLIPKEIYGLYPEYFSFKFHNGGVFSRSTPGRQYLNGKETFIDLVDPDALSIHEVNVMVKELGYPGTYMMYYHFLIPNSDLDFGLHAFACDQDVIELLKYVPKHHVINVYVEHGKTNLKTYFMSPSPKKVIIEELPDDDHSVEDGSSKSRKKLGSSKSRKKLCLEWYGCGYKEGIGEGKAQGVGGVAEGVVDFDYSALHNFDPFFGEDCSVFGKGNEEGKDMDKGVGEKEKTIVHTDESSSEDSGDTEFTFDDDEFDYMAEVDMSSFHENVDWEAEWVGNETANSEDELGETCDSPMDFEDFDSDSSGNFESARKRELRKLKKIHKQQLKEDSTTPDCSFFVGQSFATKEEVKNRITMHSIPVFKNDIEGGSSKQAKASGSSKQQKASGPHCPWVLHVSTTKNESTWLVKTYVGTHTCVNAWRVKLCTAKVLSQQIVEDLIPNPDLPLKTIQEQWQKKFQLWVSAQQVFRARKMATKKVMGDYAHQYSSLREYILELQKSNPNTTVKLEMEIEPNPETSTRQFKRVYVCLGALKHGFKAMGRDLLGLDGSFMKGPFPGQLLIAVGVDSNNGIYPVAYAIVEAETLNSWTWFLELLGDDLDLAPNSNFTFISDRQKGILPAIAKVFPAVEHRFCIRHIHENMKLRWKGKAYKDLLWKCATATIVPQFQKEMEELRKFNADTYNWLKEISPHHWSRSHFTGRAQCDVLLNNMCEVFNRQLVGGRDKPIITALEFCREYLMKRLVIVQKVSGAWGDQCCVDLLKKTCACRKWELTGIPCKHAVAAIWYSAVNGSEVDFLEKWLHPYYHLDTWRKMYAFKIKPVNGRSLWPTTNCPIKITPPKHHTHVGRPKKSRRKTAEELSQPLVKGTKLQKIGKTVTCRRCKQIGHNSRTCKKPK